MNGPDLPAEFHWFWWAVFGLFVGSFLNVAIHRLPRPGMTVAKPRRSQCPNCQRELTWKENIPLASWMVQLGRCRGCGWRIPWRYPLVELLTAALWFLAAWMTPTGQWDLTLVRVLVLSGLVVATFVDFEFFEIPDEISIGGMIAAPIASFLVPSLHADTYLARLLSSGDSVDRLGALLASLVGLAVGGGVLLAIGSLGKLLFRRDAMGLGDVKLLAAAGGFIGPGGALAALVLGSVVASLAGVLNVVRFLWVSRSRARRRGARRKFARSLASARVAGRYLPFGPYLALGIGIVLLAWNHVLRWLPQ
ncbi:MAG TPA: prepilin peptidase [Planctomycetota bacterium]|nr:prepilin peptidase [Planctomycetota bacterium]